MNRTYGEKPLKQSDLVLSVTKTREELEEAIDYENKRSNIDSAKKRAVLYGYDYEGFRQMVLGAHLFSIKSNDLNKFSQGEDSSLSGIYDRKKVVLNSEQTTFNNVNDLSMRNQQETEAFNIIIAEQLGKSELIAKNFREFRKNFDKFYQKDLNEVSAQMVYMLLKAQNYDSIKKIFMMDFDIAYFNKILEVFEFVFKNAIIPNKNIDEMLFIVHFLHELSKLKDFQFQVPGFLSKAEKQYLKQFIININEQIKSNFPGNLPPELDDVVKYYQK